jgi:hypothetical protein
MFYAYDVELTKALEDGFEEAGYKGVYRALADLMAEWYGKPGKSAYAMNISDNYLVAGAYDLAIDWLEKAYGEHDPILPYLGLPHFDPLRSNPRFQDLLRKMNLTAEEQKSKAGKWLFQRGPFISAFLDFRPVSLQLFLSLV